MNLGGMIESERHHFVALDVITDSGENHQQMLKVGQRRLGDRILHLSLGLRLGLPLEPSDQTYPHSGITWH